MVTRIFVGMNGASKAFVNTEALVRARYVVEEGLLTVKPLTCLPDAERFLRGITVSGRTIEMFGDPKEKTWHRIVATFPGGSKEFAADVVIALLDDGEYQAFVTVLPESHVAVLDAARVNEWNGQVCHMDEGLCSEGEVLLNDISLALGEAVDDAMREALVHPYPNMFWEDSKSTKDKPIRLSDNFMWLIDPNEDEALGVVCRDREVYGDDEVRWSVRPHKEHHVCASFEEGKQKVNDYYKIGRDERVCG